jgi:hypothetical protein
MDSSSVSDHDLLKLSSIDFPILFATESLLPNIFATPSDFDTDFVLPKLTENVFEMVVLNDLSMSNEQGLGESLGHDRGFCSSIVGMPKPRRISAPLRLNNDGWYGLSLMFLLFNGMHLGPVIVLSEA